MDGDAYCENDQKSEGLLRLSVPAEVAQQRLTGARGQERRHGERASRSSRSLTSDSSSARYTSPMPPRPSRATRGTARR